MKNTRTVMLFCLLVVGTLGWTEENKGTGLVLTGRVMGSIACSPLIVASEGNGLYITPSLSLDWRSDAFGIGLEVRGLTSPTAQDFYLLAFLVARTGWFFFGGGFEIPLVSAVQITNSMGNSLLPALTLGMDIPIVPIGPGKLGLTASVDLIYTYISIEGSSAAGDVILTILNTVYGIMKATAGLNYSIPF